MECNLDLFPVPFMNATPLISGRMILDPPEIDAGRVFMVWKNFEELELQMSFAGSFGYFIDTGSMAENEVRNFQHRFFYKNAEIFLLTCNEDARAHKFRNLVTEISGRGLNTVLPKKMESLLKLESNE